MIKKNIKRLTLLTISLKKQFQFFSLNIHKYFTQLSIPDCVSLYFFYHYSLFNCFFFFLSSIWFVFFWSVHRLVSSSLNYFLNIFLIIKKKKKSSFTTNVKMIKLKSWCCRWFCRHNYYYRRFTKTTKSCWRFSASSISFTVPRSL